MKICPKCKIEKPLTDFHKSRVRKCKSCYNEYARHYWAENRNKIQSWPSRSRTALRKINRRNHLKRKFNLMPEDIPDVCMVCGSKNLNGRALSVDHCHVTGRVRGVLCGGCNVALGAVKDNPITLRTLAIYLESQNESSEIEAVC